MSSNLQEMYLVSHRGRTSCTSKQVREQSRHFSTLFETRSLLSKLPTDPNHRIPGKFGSCICNCQKNHASCDRHCWRLMGTHKLGGVWLEARFRSWGKWRNFRGMKIGSCSPWILADQLEKAEWRLISPTGTSVLHQICVRAIEVYCISQRG